MTREASQRHWVGTSLTWMLAGTLCATPASAQDARAGSTRQSRQPDPILEVGVYRPNQSPYRVWPLWEVSLLVAGGLATGVPRFIVDTGGGGDGPSCGLSCDPHDVNAFDRPLAGQASQTAGDVSDYLMYSFIPLPFVLDLVDVAVSDPHDGWSGYGVDSLVLLEAMAVSLYVNSAVSLLTHRPRPYVYNDSTDDDFRQRREASMSFYSGHTSVVFAAATAYSRLFMLRHPQSGLVLPVWILTHCIASTIGVVRVGSGSHFPSDVIVGAATGVGFGLLIPWLHELPAGEQGPSTDPDRVGVRLQPRVSDSSIGLVGSVDWSL